MVAKEAQLELCLEHAEHAFPVQFPGPLSDSSDHDPLCMFILVALFFGELQHSCSVLRLGQVQQVFRATQAYGIEKLTETLGSNGTTLLTLVKRHCNESPKCSHAVERTRSDKGEKRADVFQPILDGCTCETPAGICAQLGNGSIKGGALLADYVG
jgi:hypothetical protein